jgi:glyoxylase-like metal-dependent hydrolase (beta-lactamase superfamily II)
MRHLKNLFLVIAFAIAGCAPEDHAQYIDALPSGAASEERTKKTGLSTSLAPADGFESFGRFDGDRSFHSDIALYETVLSYGPLADPRPAFLLANNYIVANQQDVGITFFQRVLKRYENQITDDQRATYLAAYALLRATYADKVALPARIFWIRSTFDILEEAKSLAAHENPLARWASGIVYTQVPEFFGKRDQALEDLLWLARRPELEPTPGFYREVYRHLSKIYEAKGDSASAANYLKKSGYQDYEPQTLFSGWFSTTKEKGLLFSPTPWIEDIVPGRVFAVRGFGFSDLHFVVSDDGRELISIDGATQPYSMKAGYEFLITNRENLPPLTTAIITHAHWDHIGGYTYLKSLNPEITIYGRDNYHNLLKNRVLRNHAYKQFRGAEFEHAWIEEYEPDIAVNKNTNIDVGGTGFSLIPVSGGETEDALLIHVPELDVLFMGDALMPFYGEPWVEEGDIEGALAMMDAAIALDPKTVLHGHVGVTVMYPSAKELRDYRRHYEWLVSQTRQHIANGYSAKEIQRLNLIPPGLQRQPTSLFGYLSPRNHVITRVADNMTGIWRENVTGQEPEGLDVITSVEYGRMLDRYLGLSASQIEKALGRMIDGGDNQLALQMSVAAERRFPDHAGIKAKKEDAANRLRSAVQFFDPFAFTTYTELMGVEHQPIPVAQGSPPK